MSTSRLGIPDLDELLGPLVDGDNVVWVTDDDARYRRIEDAAITRALAERRPVLVVAGSAEMLERRRAAGIEVIDATPRSRLAPASMLALELDRWLVRSRGTTIVMDGLDTFARRWGTADALSFFARSCPTMLDAGAITIWRLPRRLGTPFVESVRSITQWMLELRGDRLHVLKAEAAPRSLQGRSVPIDVGPLTAGGDATAIRVVHQPASGRLAQGLAALRRDLGLTQAQLAASGGVTASAISQAEAGTRGLSIDTLLTMSDALGVPLDRIVAAPPDPGYRLARHDRDRREVGDGVTALIDDPRLGLRAHLVTLTDTEAHAPPFTHNGVELVAVVSGLVQIDTGGDAPVLRASDSALMTTAHIRSWRSLRPEPAVFYWVLRDHQQGWSPETSVPARP